MSSPLATATRGFLGLAQFGSLQVILDLSAELDEMEYEAELVEEELYAVLEDEELIAVLEDDAYST